MLRKDFERMGFQPTIATKLNSIADSVEQGETVSEIDRRIAQVQLSLRPDWASKSGIWFAWRPVFTGALGGGKLVWLKRVWRNRCMGVTIYQELEGE